MSTNDQTAEDLAATRAAEAMREACAKWRENRRSHPHIENCNCFSCHVAFKDAAAIRALPLVTGQSN